SRGKSADIDLLLIVAVQFICELNLMLGHVDVSAGKHKFPIGVADCGDRGNHLLQEGLIGYVLVQLCNADEMLIRKQPETVQQLLVGDEDKVGLYKRIEKVVSAR